MLQQRCFIFSQGIKWGQRNPEWVYGDNIVQPYIFAKEFDIRISYGDMLSLDKKHSSTKLA